MDKKKWVNGVVLVLAAGCVLAVLASGFYHISNYKKQLLLVKTVVEAQKQTIDELTAERDTLKAKPPVVITQTYAPPPPATPQTDVQAVFDPQGKPDDYQAKIDDLKKRYEDVLVSYFVLRQCDQVPPTDYHIVTSALSQEMASLDAPGRLQYDILTSAEGSYKELYSGTKCEAETIDPLKAKYKLFVDTVAAQFTPR